MKTEAIEAKPQNQTTQAINPIAGEEEEEEEEPKPHLEPEELLLQGMELDQATTVQV